MVSNLWSQKRNWLYQLAQVCLFKSTFHAQFFKRGGKTFLISIPGIIHDLFSPFVPTLKVFTFIDDKCEILVSHLLHKKDNIISQIKFIILLFNEPYSI